MAFTEDVYYQEKFAKLSLTGETIKTKTFEECEFNDCSFINCKFEKSKFLNCRFNGCVLSAIIPLDCRFMEVIFSSCKVIGVDWTRTAHVRELDFHECQINYSSFKLMKAPKIKIVKCEAKEVDFTEADLSQGDFKNTNFEKSRFFKTDLSLADFRGANGYFIDTKTCLIKKARFSLPEALSLLNGLDIILE